MINTWQDYQEGFNDASVLGVIAKEILASIRELTLKLGVTREHLRKVMSKYPSP